VYDKERGGPVLIEGVLGRLLKWGKLVLGNWKLCGRGVASGSVRSVVEVGSSKAGGWKLVLITSWTTSAKAMAESVNG
jgi:hypothetical protein